MPIYTGSGDEGETGLWGGRRVSKADPRVEAYGTVDELNAHLGLLRSQLPGGDRHPLYRCLLQVQDDLFVVGAQLARPDNAGTKGGEGEEPASPSSRRPTLAGAAVSRLEEWIDATQLPPLHHFILPGGHPAAAQLHVCRAVARRAERTCVHLARQTGVSLVILTYLNRLSDYLFVAARFVNQEEGVEETPWPS